MTTTDSQLKVILVNAGPHKSGCTDRALREVAGALEENGVGADVFWVGTKPLASCVACKRCAVTSRCVFDDRVNEFTTCVARTPSARLLPFRCATR